MSSTFLQIVRKRTILMIVVRGVVYFVKIS
jgi:hypothetical protein